MTSTLLRKPSSLRYFYLSIIAFLFFGVSGFSQSYNALYAKDIAITEAFGVNQTGYIQYLEINTSSLVTAGKMQADGDDIRFVSDCGQNDYIDYYIHRGMNTTKTEIYVRIPSINANQTDTIQMLYGDNSAALGSSFPATFPDSLITSGANVTDSGVINAGWIHIKANDTLFLRTTGIMDLRAAYIQIDGVIDGVGAGNQSSATGFSNGGGSGGGTWSTGRNAGSGGGAYGGDGGDGGYDSGDVPGRGGADYGSRTSKAISKGSAGSTAAAGTRGGHGGGALSIQATKFVMSGKIFMDGTKGLTPSGQCPGGGSGGGVLILGDSVTISSGGSISAKGGAGETGTSTANDGGGGGGGGRVKIFGDAFRTASPTMSVAAGLGGGYGGAASGQAGDIGTTYGASWTFPSYTIGSELLAGPFSVLSSADTVCAGTAITLRVTNPGSVTWSNGDTNDSTTVRPNATTSYYVYGTSASGCLTSDTTEIFVPTPSVNLGPDTNNCGPITLDAIQTGGAIYIWSTGDTAATTNILSTGTYSVTASIAGCAVADTITMTIDTIPIVTLTTSQDSICEGDSVQLTGLPLAGVYSGLGVSGNNFSSIISSSGLHRQIYRFTDVNGCFERDTTYIYAQAQPVVTLGATTFNSCIGSSEILRGFPLGGTYSGIGVTDSTFNSNTSGLGTFGVSYFFTDSIGCSGTASDSVVVNALPSVSLSIAIDSMCIGISTSMMGTPSGGSYSGPGVTNTAFSSLSAGAGVHLPVYSYRDANLCWNYDTVEVVVNPIPNIVFNYDDTICQNEIIPLAATPAGGTFTGTGVVNNNSFDSRGMGVGYRSFTYDVTDLNGCFASAQGRMLISPSPNNVSITLGDDSLCEGEETSIAESHLGTGVLTGVGVDDTVWSSAGLSAGSYSLFYMVTNSNGCTTYDTSIVVLNANPVVNLNFDGDTVCIGDSAVLMASPSGGILTGSGLLDSLFVSSLTGIGTFGFTYEFTTSAGCFGMDSTSVIVDSCILVPESVFELGGVGFELYPNPTDGVVHIYLNNPGVTAHLEVLNSLGQVVSRKEILGGQHCDVNIEGPTGIYFIDLKMDNDRKRVRVMKRR